MDEGGPGGPDMRDPARQRAFAALVSEHYGSLREIAQRTLRAEQETVGFGAAAIAPTSLVTETVIRLMNQRELPSREAHLRGLACVFMTRVIADRRRARLAARRDVRATTRLDTEAEIEEELGPGAEGREDLERLEHAMIGLAACHPREMEVVTLHSVAGIPMDRIAEMLGVHVATAHRDLASGRERLARALRRDRGRG